MSLSIPADIVEEIIDSVQDLNDVKSLRNLALTSHLFLRRSQYHLFSRHIRINSIDQLNSFCDFLDSHPDRRLLVRSVTMSATSVFLAFRDVPVQFLTSLPNLYYWRIIGTWPYALISSELLSLRYYAQAITHLHLNDVLFQSCADFVRYILAFPGLRHLRSESLEFERKDDDLALVRARLGEHLDNSLRLSHLTINGTPKIAVPLLLGLTQNALQELVIEVTSNYIGLESDVNLPTLIPLLPKLSSVTLQACFIGHHDENTGGIIQYTVEILQALASNPNSLITHVAIHLLDRNISKLLEHLQNHSDDLLQMCRTLESALLRLPRLQKIELCHHLRRPLHNWTPMRLEDYLPALHQRGLIDIRCLAPLIQCHSDKVSALAVSPDGRWIASGSDDTTIILWDALRGTVVHDWLAHPYSVRSLVFSRNSRHLASSSYDGVTVWCVDEGGEVRLVSMLEGQSDLCVGSDDGTIMALGAWNETVHIWNPSTNWVQLHSLEGYPEDAYRVYDPILSPGGRWIALAQYTDENSRSWEVWDARTGRQHKVFPGLVFTDYRNEPAFDPATGGRIVIASNDLHSARIWDVETGEQLAVLEGYPEQALCTAFSLDGTRVMAASDDGMVTLWDSSSGDILISFRGDELQNYAVCSPDGRYVASTSDDHTITLWNASDGSCIRTFTEHDAMVEYMAFGPDGETLISGGDDGLVCIRRLRDVCPEGSYSGGDM